MTQTIRMELGRVVVADGTEVFYRAMGAEDAPVFLLLHGYPASSFQFRNLMPILAAHYRVIAPDHPGFGFTTAADNYDFTFDNLSKTIESFIDTLKLSVTPFPVYIFDYGAPIALRILLRRPTMFSTIVTQNGNAYKEGLGDAWSAFGIRGYWNSPTEENREALRNLLTLDSTKFQYEIGHPSAADIPPETYHLDYFISNENAEAMLDLFYDYRKNVDLYPTFSAALKKANPFVLAVWGTNDPFFLPAGAVAYAQDVAPERIKVVLLDAGHFVLESHCDEVGSEILRFMGVV